MGFLNRNRFILLFCSLLFFLIAAPIVQELRDRFHSQLPSIVEAAAVFLVLTTAVLSVSENRRLNFYALGLGLPAIMLGLLPALALSRTVEGIRTTLEIAFLSYVIFLLLRHVFLSRRVNANTLFAALSVYLLLGVLWALAFGLVDLLEPSAFGSTLKSGSAFVFRTGGRITNTAVYFSFTTLTTLGYGDIVPVAPAAQTLATLEALIGQLYLAVLIARLVGLHIAESMSTSQPH
jgi:hypothetical protein